MRHPSRLLGLFLGLMAGATVASAGNIGPGSPAPALDVKHWFKGAPVKGFSPKGTYVVEFWATWCGPCRTTIPHLTELAKKNPDVKFLGISIWEDFDQAKIQKFVDDMGPKMDYAVGYSGNKEGMSVTWMEAAAQNGIPSAFIVKDGTIQWIGHPMKMDQPLAEIKAGKFDLAAFKAKFEKEAEEERVQMAARAKINGIQKLWTDGKRTEAKAALDQLVKESPAMSRAAENIRFTWLAEEDPAAWTSQATARVRTKDLDALTQVYNVGMAQTRPNGNKELGLKIADLFVKETEGKDFVASYYAATLAARLQDWKRAQSYAEIGLTLFEGSQFKANDNLKQTLLKIQSDAKAKTQG